MVTHLRLLLSSFLKLLKSDLCTLSLKFCLDVLSLFLGSALLKNLRSAVYNVLSFL